MRYLGVDLETWGRGLPTRGLDNYTSDPDFQVLIAATYLYPVEFSRIYDFVLDPTARGRFVEDLLAAQEAGCIIGAHNAGFEEAAFATLDPRLAILNLADTAVQSRALGASSRLAFAAPQLLDKPKLDSDKHLMKMFSMSPEPPTREFVRAHMGEWIQYKEYCLRDAELSFELLEYKPWLFEIERPRQLITRKMNRVGWPVDVALVKEMQARYLANCAELLEEFRQVHDSQLFDDKGKPLPQLNLDSPMQLKRWCEERGIKAKSFDETAVAEMIPRIKAKLDTMTSYNKRWIDYYQVLQLLELKQALGGSSLSKLSKILDLVGPDNRLRHQYLHCGAGQTYRTSGVGVQMQNLKRITHQLDVDTVYDWTIPWTNDDLASNIRQVFTSSDPDGQLVVIDLSSIESRGLAYLAGEQWKLDEYAKGRDMYRVLGAKMAGLTYDEVPKDSERRRSGKVGELSCGYNAGAGAVRSFAKKMGIDMTVDEAGTVVDDWRGTNPKIVDWWAELQAALTAVVDGHSAVSTTPEHNGTSVKIYSVKPPKSLAEQHPGAKTLRVSVCVQGNLMFTRTLQGVYRRGKDFVYFKPKETQGDQVWTDTFRNPKTKQLDYYRIYGGKLAGIITQSLCRELFFKGLERLDSMLFNTGVDIIGQFHDEIVMDWNPNKSILSLEDLKHIVMQAVTQEPNFPGFPFDAEIKSDYRYTK